MNKKLNKQIKGAFAVGLAIIASPALMAQEAVNSAGMTDTTKLWILLGMLFFQVILAFTISGIIKNIAGNKSLWSRNKSNTAAGVVTVLLLLSGPQLFAQGAEVAPYVLDEGLENLLIALNGTMLLLIVIELMVLRGLIKTMVKRNMTEEEVLAQAQDDWLGRLGAGLTDAVPVENEEEVLMDDHNYDGIYELDNNLPPWWVYGFYVTIIFAVGYIWYYHVQGDGDIMASEYREEMRIAEEEKEAYLANAANLIDESSVTLLTDASSIEAGREIFEGKGTCKSCHGADLGGGIGPNLTDDFWKHGCDIKDVFATIKYGVTEKGMISWKDQLTGLEMQQVSSYILSKQGTNVAGGTEPYGDPCSAGASEEMEMPVADSAMVEEAPMDSTITAEIEE